MRTPLSSCRKTLTLVSCGGDSCVKGSVVACGILVLVPSRLVCDGVRGRGDDEGGMIAGDESCGRVKGKCGILSLLDVFGGLEG